VLLDNSPDGPTAKIGIQGLEPNMSSISDPFRVHDIITAINGSPIKNSSDFYYYIHNKSVGDKVLLTTMHDGDPGSHYANPIFSWKDPIAVTAVEFMKSSVLGQRYKNNIFIGDYNIGNLYYFEVNNTRTGIKLDPTKEQVFGLSNLVVDNSNQLSTITFGNGFGGITDIKTGPADGFIYILSINDGNIYKIVPLTSK